MSFISRVYNTLTFNTPSAPPSEIAPAGVPPGAIAHTTQAAGITEAVSSSHGLGGRIVRPLTANWQVFSLWAHSITGTATAAEIQNFDLENLPRISGSILNRLSNEETTKLLTWAREDDSRLMTLLPVIMENLTLSQIQELLPHIRFSFLEKLAASNPCAFKKLMMAKDTEGKALIHMAISSAVGITAFIPVLELLEKADPSSFHDTFKEMMADTGDNDETPMHMAMKSADSITAFIPILELLEKTSSSSGHDTLKEIMIHADHYGYTPMHQAMGSAASIAAFIPILELLAEKKPSLYYDTLIEIMGYKTNIGYMPMHSTMLNADSITASIPVLELLAKAGPSSFYEMFTEMLVDRECLGFSPVHQAMRSAASITAFVHILELLADARPSSFHIIVKEILMHANHYGDTPMHHAMRQIDNTTAFIRLLEKLSDLGMDTEDLNEIMQAGAGNGQTLIQRMQDELPRDDFENFLRNSALNIDYSSQTGNVSLH